MLVAPFAPFEDALEAGGSELVKPISELELRVTPVRISVAKGSKRFDT